MKAYVRTDASSDRVELQDVALPQIDADEVLVKMSAFGVGVHDRYFIPKDANFPYVIGLEGAGIISKVGSQVKEFRSGDKVILSSSLLAKGGSWAQFVAVPQGNVVHLPKQLDLKLAAVLPVAGKTAMECFRALNLTAGDTLFIAGASGAIGTLVIQLARNQGVRVIASASKGNHEYMQSLGAQITVDYQDPHWKQAVLASAPNGVDIALAIQRNTTQDSMEVVKDHGTVISVSGDLVTGQRGIDVKQLEHRLSFQEAIDDILNIIISGKLSIVVEKQFAFADALDALQKTETRHARGKLLVNVESQ